MASFRASILALAVLLMQGCSSFQGAPNWEPAALNSTDALFDDYVEKFFKSKSTDDRISLRNEYMTKRMAQIDRSYIDYKQAIYSQRVSSAVGIDLATMTLAGTAAAVSDVGTKTGASALAALLTGTKTSIDKNVYFDRTLPAMLSQMDALRAEVRARLYAGALLPANLYSLSQADADLTEYRQAGTIPRAIAAVTNQAGQAQTAADKVLRDRLPSEESIRGTLQQQGFSVQKAAVTDTTKLWEKCYQLKEREEFKTWFAAKQPAWVVSLPEKERPPPSITPVDDFMTIGAYEPLRQMAVKDPTLGPLLKSCN